MWPGATESTGAGTEAAAGNTWASRASEHIGKILVDPRDGNVVFVAAEGPLWSSGGERGLYRTEDGGETWEAVLTVDANTGVTDVEFDPVDPDIMYAATYERRRSVWALLAGGPGSGIHKSTDGGRTWRRVGRGLPDADMGKIGLAVSGADRNVVYATIEAGDERPGLLPLHRPGRELGAPQFVHLGRDRAALLPGDRGVARTMWDLVYQMDVFVHVTRDGGATFAELGTGREKHSDNHAFWIDPAMGGICWPGPTRASTRPSTRERRGGTFRTCPCPSSTSWRSTTPSRSTTSSAARRTWGRSTGPRAR